MSRIGDKARTDARRDMVRIRRMAIEDIVAEYEDRMNCLSLGFSAEEYDTTGQYYLAWSAWMFRNCPQFAAAIRTTYEWQQKVAYERARALAPRSPFDLPE